MPITRMTETKQDDLLAQYEENCEILELKDKQQVWVRLSWCKVIYAKLTRTGLTSDNERELFDIILKAIDSVNINPITGKRINREDCLPSLHVPRYGSMSVGDIKGVLNPYGTTLFSCILPKFEKGDIEVFQEQGKHKLVRKLVPPKISNNK